MLQRNHVEPKAATLRQMKADGGERPSRRENLEELLGIEGMRRASTSAISPA